MDNKVAEKIEKKYTCNLCDYNTSKKYNYNKHLQTIKHIDRKVANQENIQCMYCYNTYMYINDLLQHQKICEHKKNNHYLQNGYSCHCGKSYQYKSGLSRHKNLCKLNNKLSKKETDTNWKEMFIELMKKNTEILEEVKEIAKEPKIINNTQFNIMNYLNNECKDAMNLSDFINELPFSIDDLEIMGTKGYQQSMEETFIKQLRDMEKTKRPIHCSDRKRKSFYIKDDNIWERDEDNSKIVNGLKKISQKHLGMLSSWTNYNKNWSHNERKQDFFNKSVQEVAKYNDYK
jgi:hypothetical protein